MRSLVFVILAALVCTASAGANHSNGTGPTNDLAAGAGKFATTTGPGGVATAMEFSFSAHRTMSGLHGNVNFRGVDFTGVELSGKGAVQCFEVTDNRAMVIFEFEGVQPFGEAFRQGLLLLEDNGQPSDATPDRAIATGINVEGEPLPECPELADVAGIGTLPLESGNVLVHEGTE